MSTITYEDLKGKDGKVYASNVEVETLDPEPFNPSDLLKSAIESGSVKTETKVVQYDQTEGSGDNKKVIKAWRQSFTALFATDEAGMLVLPAVNGDPNRILDFVNERNNYQGSVVPRGEDRPEDYEKEYRGQQDIYVRLRNMGQGPEKAIAKVNKALAGLSGTALEQAKEQMRALLGL